MKQMKWQQMAGRRIGVPSLVGSKYSPSSEAQNVSPGPSKMSAPPGLSWSQWRGHVRSSWLGSSAVPGLDALGGSAVGRLSSYLLRSWGFALQMMYFKSVAEIVRTEGKATRGAGSAACLARECDRLMAADPRMDIPDASIPPLLSPRSTPSACNILTFNSSTHCCN